MTPGSIMLTMWLAAFAGESSVRGDFDAAIDEALPRVVKLHGARVGRQPGYGTGVLVSSDGQVVTTLSSLLEAPQVWAVTSDGRSYPVRVMVRDTKRQLALLQLDWPQERDAGTLPYFEPGDTAELRVGDWVIAVGNPFKVADGTEPLSIAVGVFGARTPLNARQRLEDYPYKGDVLVIDAITSTPGSAGGALVDAQGRWLGMLGETVISRFTNTRLNYAIPADEVTAFLRDARAGRASEEQSVSTRPTAGKSAFHGLRIFEQTYRRNRVFVEKVARGSPAEAAGVRPDDRIVSVNGILVPAPRDFHRIADRLSPGDQLVLVVERGDQLITLRIALVESSEP